MNLSKTNYTDKLFFFGMGTNLLEGHIEPLSPYLKPVYGDDWFAQIGTMTVRYENQYAEVIKEGSETSRAVVKFRRAVGHLSTWRDTVVATARMMPEELRRLAMQAGGWGLGAPRTAKQARNIVATVKTRMQTLRQEFLNAGLSAQMIDFPAHLLDEMAELDNEVSSEKAEDSVARNNLRTTSNKLIEMYRVVDNGIKAGFGEASLFDGDLSTWHKLREAIDQALIQARVQSHKKASDETLPPSLIAEGQGDESGEGLGTDVADLRAHG